MTYINILAQAAPAEGAQAVAAPAPAEGAQTTTTTQQPADQPAADQPQPEGGFFAGNVMITLILLIVIFYFLLIRPQTKQRKEQQEREAGLKEGDKVVTIGGQHGIIREVLNDTVKVEIAPNVVVKFVKGAIAQNLSKASSKK